MEPLWPMTLIWIVNFGLSMGLIWIAAILEKQGKTPRFEATCGWVGIIVAGVSGYTVVVLLVLAMLRGLFVGG